MDDQSKARTNIAQELGADPAAAASHPASGAIHSLSIDQIARDVTRSYPFAMLGLAFLLGVIAGRK